MPTTTRSTTTKSTASAAATAPAPNFPNRSLFVGDNLYALRGINSGCVDLIYLDPPFNSNRTYNAPHGSRAQGAAFKDTWTLDDWDAALEQELEIADKGAYHTINAAGEHHGDGMRSYLGYMYVRLAEMHRILKPDGSLYLHCDDTASHYLKILLDTLFGAGKFRNEITWKRQSAHNDSKAFGRVSDTILFYGDSINSDAVRVPLNPDYVSKAYRYKDDRGVFRASDLTAKGLSGGGYMYDFHGHPGPWRYPETRMLELEEDGRIHMPKKVGGVPRLRRYLHEGKGQVSGTIWTDIPPVTRKERTGYPTQKPLALLERIILASSKPGDMVLDPFCGCATTCVAAEKLGREWAGIDISEKAVELVNMRLREHLGLEGTLAVTRRQPPARTDGGDKTKSPNIRELLYSKQDGRCAGCRESYPLRNLETDHIHPRSRGGADIDENLQLLCGFCNRTKGDRPQIWLLRRLDAMRLRGEL